MAGVFALTIKKYDILKSISFHGWSKDHGKTFKKGKTNIGFMR